VKSGEERRKSAVASRERKKQSKSSSSSTFKYRSSKACHRRSGREVTSATDEAAREAKGCGTKQEKKRKADVGDDSGWVSVRLLGGSCMKGRVGEFERGVSRDLGWSTGPERGKLGQGEVVKVARVTRGSDDVPGE